MAINSSNHPALVLLVVMSSFLLPTAAGISDVNLEAAIVALRSRGYNLFGNAITVSDLRFDLLAAANSSTCTLFSPTDAALFSLDMSLPAASYIRHLRYHVALRRLPLSDLVVLAGDRGGTVPTLLPYHNVTIFHRRSGSGDQNIEILTADGVDIVVTGIFDSPEIVVHGLASVLSLRKPIKPLRRRPDLRRSPLASMQDHVNRPSPETRKSTPTTPDLSHPMQHPPPESQELGSSPTSVPSYMASPAWFTAPGISPTLSHPAWFTAPDISPTLSPTWTSAPELPPFFTPTWSPFEDISPAPSSILSSSTAPASSPLGDISLVVTETPTPSPSPLAASPLKSTDGYVIEGVAYPSAVVVPRDERPWSESVAVADNVLPTRSAAVGACLGVDALLCSQMQGFANVIEHVSFPPQHSNNLDD